MKPIRYWSIRNKKTKKLCISIDGTPYLVKTKKHAEYVLCIDETMEPVKVTITEGWK